MTAERTAEFTRLRSSRPRQWHNHRSIFAPGLDALSLHI
jgi:hypothetical protein